MTSNAPHIGYLPDERPPLWKLLLYALQQVIVMFPATIAVALLTGFYVSTTIFASGLATICFILITGRKIPLYYGSSFSYLSAILGLMAAQSKLGISLDAQIGAAQFGIIMSGFVSIGAGFLVKAVGRDSIEKILPASVTGPIAISIGLTLAANAMMDAAGTPFFYSASVASNLDSATLQKLGWVLSPLAGKEAWIISLSTLLATILFSVYLKGFLKQLPLLLGPITGCVVAYIVQVATGVPVFRAPVENIGTLFALPHFTLPIPSWAAVLAIMPIAIATIPESTAHVYQLDIYVNDLSRKKGGKVYNIADKLGLNLIGDGIGDMVAGIVGGPAGTNYGENISAMAITKVFSSAVLIAAAIIAMIIACFTPLINAIYAIPTTVIGGLEIYLFGAIAAQGVAIMMDKKTDMFNPKNIAVIATILIIGIGGKFFFDPSNGTIPFFGIQLPCIAVAAVSGILLNLLLSIGEKKNQNA
jgi:uracil permease